MLAYGHAHHTASHHPGAAAKEMVTVPQVVGEKFNDAVHEITRAGLRQDAPGYTGTIGNPHYNGNCKRVLSQAPRAGTRVPKEAMVAIVYGVCPHAIANGHHSLKSGG